MSKLWSSLLVLVVVGMVAVGSAFAADAPKKKREKGKRPSAEQIFKKLDADKDGKVTAEELVKSPRIQDEAKAKAVIGKWDANKDGSVCCGEFTKALQWRHAHAHKKGEHKKGEHKKGGDKKECPKKGCPKKDGDKKAT